MADDLRGWEIENYSATMTSPSFAQLNAQPVCCSASTDGVVTGLPLQLDIYDIETLRASSGKLRGRILLYNFFIDPGNDIFVHKLRSMSDGELHCQ